MFPTYSSLIGFFVGAGAYYVLAKYWWFVKYPQAEIVNPNDDLYLGITAGRDWHIGGNPYRETEPNLVPEPLEQPVIQKS